SVSLWPARSSTRPGSSSSMNRPPASTRGPASASFASSTKRRPGEPRSSSAPTTAYSRARSRTPSSPSIEGGSSRRPSGGAAVRGPGRGGAAVRVLASGGAAGRVLASGGAAVRVLASGGDYLAPPRRNLRATLGNMTAAARIAPELPAIQGLRQAVEGALEGKQDAVELALGPLGARGPLLIEDVPGVGKPALPRAVAKAVGGELRRVQFTSDLLPSDVLGVSVYDQRRGEFVLRQGPIFANVLLADEINRASPRTQSALLEAMNEGQVSLDGQTIPLPEPFFVIATQNPQDFAG